MQPTSAHRTVIPYCQHSPSMAIHANEIEHSIVRGPRKPLRRYVCRVLGRRTINDRDLFIGDVSSGLVIGNPDVFWPRAWNLGCFPNSIAPIVVHVDFGRRFPSVETELRRAGSNPKRFARCRRVRLVLGLLSRTEQPSPASLQTRSPLRSRSGTCSR